MKPYRLFALLGLSVLFFLVACGTSATSAPTRAPATATPTRPPVVQPTATQAPSTTAAPTRLPAVQPTATRPPAATATQSPRAAMATATRPAPQPTATRPAPQPTATQSAPQATATRPAPQATATRPAPQPTATQPAPQPTATQPAPQPTATRPAPQPTATQPAAQPTATSPAPTAAIKTSDHATLGKIVTDPGGRSLYVFDRDTPGVSNCTGGCATTWPPLAPPAGAVVGTSDITAKVEVITRADGKKQITLNGKPLYYFAGDTAAGDALGQGSGGIWWTIKGDGSKAAATSGTSPGYENDEY